MRVNVDHFKAARKMFAAIAAALALPTQLEVDRATAGIAPYKSRGKGGKKRPAHTSRRFVAQDKRDARKRRALRARQSKRRRA